MTHAPMRQADTRIWPKPDGAERGLEPVTPVGRQQLPVGHGAECMVGQEGRAVRRATATAISSKRIIDLAKHGERNPASLRERVLQSFKTGSA